MLAQGGNPWQARLGGHRLVQRVEDLQVLIMLTLGASAARMLLTAAGPACIHRCGVSMPAVGTEHAS